MKQQQALRARGPYKKSAGTRRAIIRAAIDTLITAGYHNFSLRKVASQAGVSIGNLQHHFESKEKLIAVMLDDVISGYLDEFRRLISTTDDPREQLKLIVFHVAEDLGTKETTMFFPELWSLANHNPDVEDFTHQMYGKYRDIYIGIIRSINPTLSDEQADRAALFFAASLEGHTMFVGYRKADNRQISAIADIAFQSFLNIIETGSIPE